jgi:HAMP domain-containing protein
MNQPRSRIALQLAMALAVLLILLISGSTLFALRSLDSATLTTREEHLASEARLLADQLETFHGTLRESTQRLAGLFEKRFAAGLKARLDERVPVAALQAPALYLGDTRLNGDFTLVDEFRQLTAGVATVFVRDGEDFVRITTSLMKQDGSRAMGTVLDHNSPAYPLLMRGESYVGRALLFDRFYMTQYTPVRDASGRVIAVLFVGFDYTDAQKRQFDNLGRFRLGQGGSLALLDEQHRWLVPPAGARNPERVADSLANLLDSPGRGRFWSDGQDDFYSVAQPFAGGPWTVVASMPKDEIRAVTWRVGGQLAMGSLIAMLLAVIATTWLLQRRLRPLGDLVRQAHALGAGDLGARLSVASRDEIGDLARSFIQHGRARAWRSRGSGALLAFAVGPFQRRLCRHGAAVRRDQQHGRRGGGVQRHLDGHRRQHAKHRAYGQREHPADAHRPAVHGRCLRRAGADRRRAAADRGAGEPPRRALPGDRQHRRGDHLDCRADQPAGAQRRHRGRPCWRAGPRVRRGRR